jgi:adenylate kinase family enzyme
MTIDQHQFRRIAVIGCSGAGKSTLARAIGAAMGLPVVHLDQEYWLPGWVEPDREAWRARLAELAARPAWVIDGQYGDSLTERLRRADLAIFLDLPTRVCLWRVVRRWLALRGRVRPDMGEGCPEKIDAEFIHWVATFRRLQRPKVISALRDSGVRTLSIKTTRAQEHFATQLQGAGLAAACAGVTSV